MYISVTLQNPFFFWFLYEFKSLDPCLVDDIRVNFVHKKRYVEDFKNKTC